MLPYPDATAGAEIPILALNGSTTSPAIDSPPAIFLDRDCQLQASIGARHFLPLEDLYMGV
jgi:xanthine dehydrogenase iron-sulfur cluster and FAD-binding subunit A